MTTSPGPTQTTEGSSGLVEAWQALLAAEHAAVYGYGVVAGRLRAEADPAAGAAGADLDEHGRRRDVAEVAVTGLGATPVAAEPGYAVTPPPADASAAAALAAGLERDCAARYADLVAASGPDDRRLPATWLVAAAAAETRWSGEVPPLPGLDGRVG